MARFEMGAADIAAMVPQAATGESFYELGLMYAAGRSVPLDLVTAHKWLNVAVAKGFRPAALRRAELADEMSPAEVAAAQREARLWLARQAA
ncbi:MAG TPA: sel1 repeat family protein [Salinarimonas sp.]|nr:sel1 repeat family protein [Salinarimonas sp.]